MGLECIDEYRRDYLKRTGTVDLAACPGSGKTTLIVAKLAILAEKWPHRTNGICVLSHTNVARDQIEQRLGHTVVAQRLLAYPHYVGTIHGFVNRFLSSPWLYGNGYPTPIIDDDIAIRRRRSVLSRVEYIALQSFLTKKRRTFDELCISARDLSFDLNGREFPANSATNSYRYAAKAITVSAELGYFRHNEMFVWARALMEEYPQIGSWIMRRFPLLIFDEMQDTSKDQCDLLDCAFARHSTLSTIQRVGDSNQAIFDIDETHGTNSNGFPDPDHVIHIPNSFRFGQDIARLASPFAVRPVGSGGLEGIGPSSSSGVGRESRNAILVFPDSSTIGVLDVFGRHVLDVFGDVPHERGVVSAIGHIHRDDLDVRPGDAHYPRAVGDYWGEYSSVAGRIDHNPSSLVQYVRLAQELSARAREVFPGLRKLANAVVRLAQGIGDVGDLRRAGRGHRVVVEALRTSGGPLVSYLQFVKHFLIERAPPVREEWPIYAQMFMAAARSLCVGEVKSNDARKFLAWREGGMDQRGPGGSGRTEIGSNVYRVVDRERVVEIRVGSIHSVKGQTHVATLLLSTYWHGHSSTCTMDWLLGNKANGGKEGTRNLQRLRHSYVAMTRPSHLLCVAVSRSSLGDASGMPARVGVLRQRGWHVAEIVDGSAHWWQ